MKQFARVGTALLLITLLAISGLSGFKIPKASASAADSLPSKWQAGNIISDNVMTNTSTMTIGDIQQFFNAHNSVCLTNYSTPDPQGNNNYGGNVSAAQALYDAARLQSINPEVLLVVLQKEQALITRQTCPDSVYQSATGYGCPDTAACASAYYGFSKQVYKTAAFFRIDMNNPASGNYPPGNDTVLYSPNGACGSSAVNIINKATASLYDYTPYQPNAAALAAGYGTGDNCSAYGNRNFYLYFTDWFGVPNGSGVAYVIADNGDQRQWIISSSGYRYYVPSPDVISAWGLSGSPVTLSANYVGSFKDGPQLSRAVRDPGSGAMYLVDSANLYHYITANQVAAWNAGSFSNIDPNVMSTYLTGQGDLGYAVKFTDGNAIYMVDGGTLRQYQSITELQAVDTTNSVTLSTAMKSQFTFGSALTNDKITAGGANYLMDSGRAMILDANLSNMYPGTAQTVSQLTINRLASMQSSYLIRGQSTSAVYVVDGGLKRHITTGALLQSFAPGRNTNNIATLSDSALANLIPNGNDVTTPYVSDGTTDYVVDGQALSLPAALQAAYLAGNTVDSTTYSSSFIQSIGMSIAQPFVTQGDGKVFIIDGAQKRWLSNLATYVSLSDPNNRQVSTLSSTPFAAIATGSQLNNPFISSGGTTYYIEGMAAYTIDSAHQAAWSGQTVSTVTASLMARYTNAGTVSNNVTINGSNYVLINGTLYNDPNNYRGLWTSDTTQAHASVLSSYFATANYALPLFASSTNPNDSRIFVKDVSALYHIGSITALQNFAGTNTVNTVPLTPVQIGQLAATDTSGLIVNLSNGTTEAVMNGQRYDFVSTAVAAQWVTSDAVTISDQLKAALPLSIYQIGDEARAQSSSPIYTIQNGQKHWIYYAPYVARYQQYTVNVLTDSFLNNYPSGSDITN